MTDGSDPSDFALRLPDGTTYAGPVVDLRDVDTAVTAESLSRAIRAGRPSPTARPTVHSPSPTRVHRHVDRLGRDLTIDRSAALAAVGAARGVETPYDEELANARKSLRELPPPPVDDERLRAARRRAAESGSETERLRERVATLRGRVTALRDAGDDDALAEVEASLSEATRRLSEVSTDRIAAAQRLERLEERARRARDTREARLELQDRVGNLQRAVREARVAAVESEFRDACSRLASVLAASTQWSSSPPSDLCDGLAVAEVAPLRAPVVVAPEVTAALGGPESTRDRLDVPLVIR